MHDKWKVLIADDEPIIREGIRDSVNWESLDLVIAAEAEDGEEALELALEHSIDILLVDLNMPIMDGITLMKALKEKLPECKFIIITGHDEFSYAQEAIRLDVNDYILKPVNPEQLQQVLSNVREQLYASKQQKEHLSLASRQIKKNFPVLRERFGLEWIGGELSAEEIMEQLRFLNLPERCPDVLGVIRWPDLQVGPPINSEQDRQLFLFAIENIVSEMLSSWEIMLFRDPSVLIIVCVWGRCPQRGVDPHGAKHPRLSEHYRQPAFHTLDRRCNASPRRIP